MRIGSSSLGQFLLTPGRGSPSAFLFSETAIGRTRESNQPLTLKVNDPFAAKSNLRLSSQNSDRLSDARNLLTRIRSATTGEITRPLTTIQQSGAAQRVTAKHVTRRISTAFATGANGAQVSLSNLRVSPFSGTHTLEGNVSRAAEAARLTVFGTSGAMAIAGGVYLVSGSRGSMQLEVVAGESLQDVAARINDQSAALGVTAGVVSNDLVLTSSELGSSATVRLQPLQITPVQVATFNNAQLDGVEISSLADGATETLNGSLVSTAQAALLTYRGGSGSTVNGTATFRLTGERGSATFAITSGEALSSVAQRINHQTAITGVVASVDGNDLRLTGDTASQTSLVRIDSVDLDHQTVISGVNAAQITDLEIASLDEGSEHTLSGEVTRSASKATLFLQGAADATVIDTGSFELSGSQGAVTVVIVEGESLASVADRVNADTELTAISARVAGTQLVFESVQVGSSAEVNVELLDIAHHTSVSGVNSQQLVAFQVDRFEKGASHILSGSVTQTASQAELVFNGFGSLVGTTATFTLTGSLGSTQISVSALQTLSAVASTVNQRSATTGVTAVVQGSQLRLRSTGVGSAATVAVQVTSGSFNVTGGNGNGTAIGLNATAIINGQNIMGAGNQFQLTDALGAYSFTTAVGFTGALSSVSIESQAGAFELSGGDGPGHDTGLDALAVINSVALTGAGNRFVVSEPGVEFEVEFADGFLGEFDAVEIRSLPDPFDVDGGDGAGTAVGADAVAIVNDIEYTSANNRFAVQGDYGNYELAFASNFIGSFDPITVESVIQPLVTDGDAAGLASGADAEAVINGQQYVGSGSRIQVIENGLQVSLDFQSDFSGEIDSFTILQRTRTMTVASSRPKVVVPSESVDAGNNTEDPLDLLLEEWVDLQATTESPPPPGSATAPEPSAALANDLNYFQPLSRATIVRRVFNEVHQDRLPEFSRVLLRAKLFPDALTPEIDLIG